MKLLKTYLPLITVAAIALTSLNACTTKKAIESRELKTSVKMSETIFLDPVEPEQKVVWIHVRNTSDRQEMDPVKIEETIAQKLEKRGYRVTNSPKEAHYRLQANILYADHKREGLTEEGMLLGGFGGALLGGEVGGGSKSKTAGQVVGVAAGAVVGGIAGSMVTVDKHMLVVDMKISEKTPSGVAETQEGRSSAGTVTTEQRTGKYGEYIEYATRMVGTAEQTNLDWNEAQPILLDKFSSALSGIF